MAAQEVNEFAVDDYVARRNVKLKPVTDAVRALVRKTVPESREMLNPWGVPTFDSNGSFCYLMVGKNHVTFGFPRGTSLKDSAGLLEGTGKNLRHVKLREVGDVHDANLRQLILQASVLNHKEPLGPSMRPERGRRVTSKSSRKRRQ